MPHSTKSQFRQRLGTYFIGLALGCVLMGFYWQARTATNARRQRAEAAAQAAAEAQKAPQPESNDDEADDPTPTDPPSP